MAITFRLCTPAETEMLLGLLADWHRQDGVGFDVPGARRQLSRLLADNRAGHLWVIELGGLAVGYTALSFTELGRLGEPRAYASALYIERRHRGSGLGDRARLFLREVGHFLHVPVLFFNTDREAKHAAVLNRTTGPALPTHDYQASQAVA